MRDPKSRTRILVRWTRESGESPGHGRNLPYVCSPWRIWNRREAGQNSESSCISKVLLPCREICVRWKSVIWRAVMAPREGWSNAFVRGEIFCTWIDKSEDLQTKEVKETCAKSAGHFSIQDTKAMVKTIIVFLLQNHSFHPLRAVPSSDIAREGKG